MGRFTSTPVTKAISGCTASWRVRATRTRSRSRVRGRDPNSVFMSPDHFRGHVEWCASEDVLRRHRHGRLPAARDHRLDETEIDHLRDVWHPAAPAQGAVGRLDVAMNKPNVVRFRERPADLFQDVDDPPRVLSAVLAHEHLEVHPLLEVLHGVVEDAGRGAPVVEDRDRARVSASPAGPRVESPNIASVSETKLKRLPTLWCDDVARRPSRHERKEPR